MAVTEIVWFPVKKGLDPNDPSNDAAKLLQKLADITLVSDGAGQIFFATQIEDPGTMLWFVDWDSVDHHDRFVASDAFVPGWEISKSLIGKASSQVNYVVFNPPFYGDTLNLGLATELVRAYFPTSYSKADRDIFEAAMKRFGQLLQDSTPDVKAVASGWVQEKVDIPGTNKTGTLFISLLAWTSVEVCMEYRNTQMFKDKTYPLSTAKDLEEVTIVHIRAKQAKRISK